jgi:hypothetical protein
MDRRSFLAMVSVPPLAAALTRSAVAVSPPSLDAATIKAALRTATPEEGCFVERIVAMTNAGRIPVELVDSTLQWARKKPKHRFQFFKQALIVRAAKQGIEL